jgi:hypothetical protein
MEVTIRIKQDDGSVVEVVRELLSSELPNPLSRIEADVQSIKTTLFPILSSHLLSEDQSSFEGEKNQ